MTREQATPDREIALPRPDVQLPESFSIREVAGDGNCLFHAIADQLQSQCIRTATGELYTHESLRTLALSLVEEEPRFRQMMSDGDYFDLARLNGYVDIWSIAALARALHMNIVIYGAPGGLPVRIDSNGDFDQETPDCPVLRVAYNGYNHYDSVVAMPASSQQKRVSHPRNAKKRLLGSPQAANPNKSNKSDSQVSVAIKIFQDRHKHMRDHERAILRELEPNYNVPYIVGSYDLPEGPALIVGPVGNRVAPVRNDGVRTYAHDYLKLLQVLEEAHMKGICHRDVKPENIFKDDTGRIILNDWSSSAKPENGLVAWAGTEFYYQKQDNHHIPQPQDDLVALVRSVFVMVRCQRPSRDMLVAMESHPFWREALQLARSLDYNGLRDFFNRHCI